MMEAYQLSNTAVVWCDIWSLFQQQEMAAEWSYGPMASSLFVSFFFFFFCFFFLSFWVLYLSYTGGQPVEIYILEETVQNNHPGKANTRHISISSKIVLTLLLEHHKSQHWVCLQIS